MRRVDLEVCPVHTAAVRVAIEARALGGFISDDLEAAARLRLGSPTCRRDYDALIEALLRITQQAVRQYGMQLADSGCRCPLCFMRDRCCDGCRAQSVRWVDIAADEQLVVAKGLGLVASA